MSTAQSLLVADRYRLLHPLGEGGMGRVWRARDEVLHRDVAIKELVAPAGLTPEERTEMQARSMREARAVARLSHPNVVRIFDVVEAGDGDPWIVMEYLPGQSLHEAMASGPLPVPRVARVGLEMLQALRAAHTLGVVHRDVKPGNILLAKDGRAVLTDFGIASVRGDPYVTRTGVLLGSPAYLAPERARHGTTSEASDLWSLGATLYAATEGKPPFARATTMETLTALATEPVPYPQRSGPLTSVLMGLLQKDPTERMDAATAQRLLRQSLGPPGAADQPDAADAEVAPAPDPKVASAADTDTPASPAASSPASPAASSPASPVEDPPASPAPDTPASPVEDPPAESGTKPDLAVVAGTKAMPTAQFPPSERPAPRVAAPPPDPPRPRAPQAPGRRRWLLAALATLAVLAVLSLVLINRLDQPDQVRPPQASAPATDQTAPPNPQLPAPRPPTTPPPSPAASPPGFQLPSGWQMRDDGTGFRVPVPDGWQFGRDQQGRALWQDPATNRLLLIDQTREPKPDPVADWENNEEARRDGYEDYQRVRLEAVSYWDSAADWEFTYTLDGTPVRVLNRGFITAPDQAYSIYWRTPADAWEDNLDELQIVLDGFVPARP